MTLRIQETIGIKPGDLIHVFLNQSHRHVVSRIGSRRALAWFESPVAIFGVNDVDESGLDLANSHDFDGENGDVILEMLVSSPSDDPLDQQIHALG